VIQVKAIAPCPPGKDEIELRFDRQRNQKPPDPADRLPPMRWRTRHVLARARLMFFPFSYEF
jgi:hypothetical protein